MACLQNKLGIVFLFLTVTALSQKANVFLDRAYWKSNPKVEEIEAKIAEGNDIAALNSSAFDAVVWALLEKVDNSTIKYLLSKKGNDVNKLTHDGRTYIFWAAYRDNLEMMEFLVSNGAKTNIIDSHGYSLLNFAAVTGQLNTKIYDFCITYGADIKKEKNQDGANSLLLVAPFLKKYDLVEYFVKKGIDLHSTDDIGNGIFNYAAKNGNMEMMNLLIQKGVSYKKLNKQGGNAMIFASQGVRNGENTLEVFQYLEKLGIQPNITTKKGRTPLHALSYRRKDLPIFEYFIKKGVDVNQSDEDGNTAFINAASRNDLEVVSFLSKYMKDIDAVNKDGKSALTIAVQRNSKEVIDFLLGKGANVFIKDKKGNNLAYYLLDTFDAKKPEIFNEKLELLTGKGFKLSEKQGDGSTLLHIAAKKNDIALLKRVKEYNVPIDAKNKEGNTALHVAAMKAENDNILKYLISIGANKAIKTGFNESVYDLANENEQLIKHNVTLNFLK